MKLQYRFYVPEFPDYSCNYIIELYQDGWLVNSYKVFDDELADEISKLKKMGYMYGYTKEELKRVKESYKSIKKAIIKQKQKDIKR